MDRALRARINEFVNENISTFHDARLAKLNKLKLSDVLRRKNPYLFRAKNINTASELVESILQAFLSSSEEELFGGFLEALTIYVSEQCDAGRKSSATGLDLELERDGTRYLVAVKSGPNWGNSSQYKSLRADFRQAVSIIRQNRRSVHVQPILGMCYGRKLPKGNGLYRVLCGQHFWEFISGESDFYLEIVKPVGYRAKQHNEKYDKACGAVNNRLTREFIQQYCDADGNIDWHKLVRFNSGQRKPCPL